MRISCIRHVNYFDLHTPSGDRYPALQTAQGAARAVQRPARNCGREPHSCCTVRAPPYLAQLFERLARAAHVVVRYIRLVLHRHHGHGRVDARRQRDLQRSAAQSERERAPLSVRSSQCLNKVFGAVHAHTHRLFDVRRCHLLAQANHKLGNLQHAWQ